MEYLNKLKNPPTLYKVCFAFVSAFVVFLVYSFFRRKDLIKTQENKDINSMSESFVSSTPAVFTMYYADWCPHCTAAKPEFQSLMKNTQNINGKAIKFVMVDCEKNPEKAEAANVQGFPTFILENDGETEVYPGERSQSGFKKFLSNMLS